MRYGGGGVGHKSNREAMCCLLNDRYMLDKQEFILKHDCDLFDKGAKGSDDNVPMDDSSASKESSDESEGPRGVRSGTSIPHALNASSMMNLATRWNSGLDQVLEDEEDGEMSSDKDALGPEDGENPDDAALEYTKLQCSNFISHRLRSFASILQSVYHCNYLIYKE